MPKTGLTGSRIRERRLNMGMRQSELARRAGISAAYLNLIEHNRRRIGGKLLIDIAAELEVEATALTQGAQEALVEALADAAAALPQVPVDGISGEEMAGRFPGWAGLIAELHRRNVTLERTVEALSDRLTHDPQLAASMHEVLSVVTAIRSTAGILTGSGNVDPEWQARFHRNIYEDSRRLAESAQALVEYLDATEVSGSENAANLPQEDLENWLQARDFHVAELEVPDPVDIEALLAGERQLARAATRAHARAYLERYRADAERLPMAALADALAEGGTDPVVLARRFGCDLALVLRRIATLPAGARRGPVGLVSCDASGTLTYRKPVEGFALPRFGAACPLWPLFQALSRPMVPIQQVLEQAGHLPRRFLAIAIACPDVLPGIAMPQLFSATMLILPDGPAQMLGPDGIFDAPEALPVGSSCRICPRAECQLRREPSILAEGF